MGCATQAYSSNLLQRGQWTQKHKRDSTVQDFRLVVPNTRTCCVCLFHGVGMLIGRESALKSCATSKMFHGRRDEVRCECGPPLGGELPKEYPKPTDLKASKLGKDSESTCAWPIEGQGVIPRECHPKQEQTSRVIPRE